MGKCVSQHFWTPIFIIVILILDCGKVSILPTEYDLEYMIDLAQKRLLADVISNIVDDDIPTYILPWQILLP